MGSYMHRDEVKECKCGSPVTVHCYQYERSSNYTHWSDGTYCGGICDHCGARYSEAPMDPKDSDICRYKPQKC